MVITLVLTNWVDVKLATVKPEFLMLTFQALSLFRANLLILS